MGYLGYYFAWLAFSYLIREPRLLVGLVVLWLVRGLLPPPGAVFGALGRAGRLREQVRLNRANVTARRDLATIYLSLLRPRRALPLLEEGLALAANDAELTYLYGVALHRAGRHEEALTRLLSALERDARLRHGHPYFVAGETLLALKRWDDAVDAFERYLDFNGSDVAAHTCLARAYAGAGDSKAAKKWLRAGLETWHGLTGALKRRQFGAYLRAQWARISVLKDASAIAVALLLLALGIGSVRAGYPLMAELWRPSPQEQSLAALQQSAALCGSQQIGDFAGDYQAMPELPDRAGASPSLSRESQDKLREVQKIMAREYANFRIERDRISFGSHLVQEFCFTRVLERSPRSLHAEAVLRFRVGTTTAQGGDQADGETEIDGELVDDPRAMALYDIRLDRGAEATSFSYAGVGEPLAPTRVTLHRR